MTTQAIVGVPHQLAIGIFEAHDDRVVSSREPAEHWTLRETRSKRCGRDLMSRGTGVVPAGAGRKKG
jgi:hypothetical protein